MPKNPNSQLGPSAVDNVPPICKIISTVGTANSATTLTIPAPTTSNFYNYITGLWIYRVNDSASAVTGTAALVITSTNLNSFSIAPGNAIAAGAQSPDWFQEALSPVKSDTAATATTIVCPAAGLGVRWVVVATYYQGEA